MRMSAFGVEDNRVSKGEPLPGKQSPRWAARQAELKAITMSPKEIKQRNRATTATFTTAGAAAAGGVGAISGKRKRVTLLDRAHRSEQDAAAHRKSAESFGRIADRWDARDLKSGTDGPESARARASQARYHSDASGFAHRAAKLKRASVRQIPLRAATGAAIGGAAAAYGAHRMNKR